MCVGFFPDESRSGKQVKAQRQPKTTSTPKAAKEEVVVFVEDEQVEMGSFGEGGKSVTNAPKVAESHGEVASDERWLLLSFFHSPCIIIPSCHQKNREDGTMEVQSWIKKVPYHAIRGVTQAYHKPNESKEVGNHRSKSRLSATKRISWRP